MMTLQPRTLSNRSPCHHSTFVRRAKIVSSKVTSRGFNDWMEHVPSPPRLREIIALLRIRRPRTLGPHDPQDHDVQRPNVKKRRVLSGLSHSPLPISRFTTHGPPRRCDPRLAKSHWRVSKAKGQTDTAVLPLRRSFGNTAHRGIEAAMTTILPRTFEYARQLSVSMPSLLISRPALSPRVCPASVTSECRVDDDHYGVIPTKLTWPRTGE